MAEQPPGLQRVVRTSVADAAYESIRNAIVSGAFAPGEQLVETRVAESMGVGRGTAREALRRLRDEGLVIGAPNRGVFVRDLTATDLVHIYNLRIGIEGVAIRLATRARASTEPLRRCVEEMRERVGAGDVPGLGDRETAFHEELCVLSGNPYLVGTFRTIAGLVRLSFAAEYAAYADPSVVPDEHLPVIEAIDSGDEDAAADALVAHIDIARSLDVVRSIADPEVARLTAGLVSHGGVASWPATFPDAAGG
jgi:DNA-binding GntR family transcriptional regulator